MSWSPVRATGRVGKVLFLRCQEDKMIKRYQTGMSTAESFHFHMHAVRGKLASCCMLSG